MKDELSGQQNELDDSVRWIAINRKAQAAKAARIFRLFEANQINPILIKGVAADLVYPPFVYRNSVDFDIAVSNHDYNKALELAASKAAGGFAIDLHKGLRHLDTMSWEELFSRCQTIETEGGAIRILSSEDHLRVLSVHWLNDGGRDRERLWDIYYAISNRKANFNWDRLLNVVSEKRRRWIVCTIGLAHKYLDLDLSETPVAMEAQNIPAWLIKAVEREWTSEIRLEPLELVLHSRKLLAQQTKAKLYQNPIWATVQMEGSFDSRTQIFYQVGNFLYRIPSSIRRITREMMRKRN